MKRVYVFGSFKFLDKIKELETKLKKENIVFEASEKMDARGIVSCLEKIGRADVVYVVNPDGYIGKSVCVDIGYAYARKKPIYAMHPIEDPPLMKLVHDVLSFEELVNLLKAA